MAPNPPSSLEFQQANANGDPLLLRQNLGPKKKKLYTKRGLKVAMVVIFVTWATLVFLLPSDTIYHTVLGWSTLIGDATIYGLAGGNMLFFTVPFLTIVVLAILLLIIKEKEEEEENDVEEEEIQIQHQINKRRRRLKFRLSTFPVLVDGLFGVVTAAELIGISIFTAYVLWALCGYALSDAEEAGDTGSIWPYIEMYGIGLGWMGINCLVFLFLPVARGSVLLRLINIPFQHAVRYHVWLGHLTVLILTLHGLFFLVAWTFEGILLTKITAVNDGHDLIAPLPGAVALVVVLLMWVTALPWVRRNKFELFFYTHQLYIVFIICIALHIGDYGFTYAFGGIFLFALDRLLRFCQSRQTVDVVSATLLPCGTVELVLSKPQNFQYNALSFVFLRIRELSRLQWHPFSLSSSPLDCENRLTVLIKCSGDWTKKLKEIILMESTSSKLTTSIEGPYGHEMPYHLMYENIILVAGGIGVSPFFAILRDLLNRIRQGAPCLPKKVQLVWAIKTSDELSVLSVLDMDSICPFFTEKIEIDFDIYITREVEPPEPVPFTIVEERSVGKTMVSPVSNKSSCGMSNILVGKGNTSWYGLYFASSLFGFMVVLGITDVFIATPYITLNWCDGILLVASMAVGIFVFGGSVLFFWHLRIKRMVARVDLEHNNNNMDLFHRDTISSSRTISYGSRPDFKEIFESISNSSCGFVDIGVMVCGPEGLEISVAKEIRSFNLKKEPLHPVLHFHSLSFSL